MLILRSWFVGMRFKKALISGNLKGGAGTGLQRSSAMEGREPIRVTSLAPACGMGGRIVGLASAGGADMGGAEGNGCGAWRFTRRRGLRMERGFEGIRPGRALRLRLPM